MSKQMMGGGGQRKRNCGNFIQWSMLARRTLPSLEVNIVFETCGDGKRAMAEPIRVCRRRRVRVSWRKKNVSKHREGMGLDRKILYNVWSAPEERW